jgi:hypothetical protein
MIASDTQTMVNFLAQPDVQALKADPEGKTNVESAEALLKTTDSNSDKLLQAIAQQSTAQSAPGQPAGGDTEEKKATIHTDFQKLVGHLTWIVEKIASAHPDYPLVGTYSELSGIQDYTPHHVPPKGLANWIWRMVDSIPADIRALTDNVGLENAARAGKVQHDGGGQALSTILLHKNTHHPKSGDPVLDLYRAHNGLRTSELVTRKLAELGITPIAKTGKATPEEAREEPEEEGGTSVRVGMPSTQFYQSELDNARKLVKMEQAGHVQAFLASVRDVFYRGYIQARSNVEIALAHSLGKNGPTKNHPTALSSLDANARSTWGSTYGDRANDLTQF